VPPEWSIDISPHAEEDLTYLKHHQRRVRQHVRNKVLPTLLKHPRSGEQLEKELAGVWSYHFWNAKYRLAYMLDERDEDHPKIVVVGIGLKDGFYEDLSDRVRSIRGDDDGEAEAPISGE
jgi:mRNA-degrading endonuclease RelE of RelBE toxin-antitoxin system